MKPNPIPDLKGQSARMFEKNIKNQPTSAQRRIMLEASIVYNQTKKRE
jgi:hypothetical protein